MKKWGWWLAGALLVGLATAANQWPAINDVTTGQTPEYPDLQPVWYAQDPDKLFAAVQAVAKAMPGWRVTFHEPRQRVLEATAWVWLTPFTDDVTVTVEPEAPGSRVIVRSRSRVGRRDLGVNARRIRAFLRALDRKVSGAGESVSQ